MLAILGLLVAFSGTAEAQPPARHAVHHGVAAPPQGPVRSTISVGAWSPAYVPPPRVGFRWTTGYFVSGSYWPGSWEPVAPAPTPETVWVPGHWEGEHYAEGYWRDENRSGMVWIKGSYDDDGNWIDGRWMDARDAEAYKRGPPGKTQMIEIPYDDSGRAATPRAVQEADPSEPAELHAPAPER